MRKHCIQSVLKLLFLLCLGISLTVLATPLQVGSPAPNLTLKDQFEHAVHISPQTRTIVFSHQKSVNAFVSEYFSNQGKANMTQRSAVYVADISAMPPMVTRMFALPKMRQLNFSIGLAREESLLADFPRRDGCATLIWINSGAVQTIQYACNHNQLIQLMQ